MELQKIINTYMDVSFIFPLDANNFIKFNNKYNINDLYNKESLKYGRKGLFSIYKDKNGKVEDFILPIPSINDLINLYSKVEDKKLKDKIINNIEFILKNSINNNNIIKLYKQDNELFKNNIYIFNKILFKINKYSPDLKNIKIDNKNNAITLKFKSKPILNIDKYNLLFKIYLNDKKNFVGYDFDGTLGETEAYTVIKRLIKDKKDIEFSKNYTYKTSLYTKEIDKILNSDDIYFINNININEIDNLKLNSNNYFNLVKYFKKDKLLLEIDNLIEISKNKNLQIQYVVINKNGKKTYYNYLNDIDINKLKKDNILKLDIKTENKNELKQLYNSGDKIELISIIIDKDKITNELIQQQDKIQVKKIVDYDTIKNDKNSLKFNVIEQTMYFDPISYNSYHKLPNDTVPDYSQFRSAKVLSSKTKLFNNVINSLKKRHNEPKNFTTILTARGKLDDKEHTLKYFNSRGIPTGHFKDNKIHLFFSGYYEIDNSFKIDKKFKSIDVVMKKLSFINKILQNTSINKIIFYEDNKKMLYGLNNFLKLNYPKIQKELYFVTKDAKIKKLNNNVKQDIEI